MGAGSLWEHNICKGSGQSTALFSRLSSSFKRVSGRAKCSNYVQSHITDTQSVNTIPFWASTWALVTGTKCGQLLKTKVSRFCDQGGISRNDDFQIILWKNFNGWQSLPAEKCWFRKVESTVGALLCCKIKHFWSSISDLPLVKLKSENYANEFQTYAGAFKCGGAESLIPEEVESKREEKNVEKLKSKSKRERRKCKEASNKKPEVSKQSFRSRRLEVIWLREKERGTRWRHARVEGTPYPLACPPCATVLSYGHTTS